MSGRTPNRRKASERGARELAAKDIGLPSFSLPAPIPEYAHIFHFSSHTRARDALAFGLRIEEPGFNIFVLGEDRSGRMTATLEHLAEYAHWLPPQSDWVYLNNFRRPAKPKPYRLPAGVGRRFRDRMAALVPALRKALGEAMAAPEVAQHIERRGEAAERTIDTEFASLKTFAHEHGVELDRSSEGLTARPLAGNAPDDLMKLPAAERAERARSYDQVRERVATFKTRMRASEAALGGAIEEIRSSVGAEAVAALLDELDTEFGEHPGLARWLVELRTDILEHLELIATPKHAEEGSEEAAEISAELRYAVNLLVDHGDEPSAQIVLEPNPTYENLFGTIEYRSVGGIAETDFTLIRAGALHRANGSVLVLRAEAVAQHPESWRFLKGALRDGCIRIEELHRQGGMPMAAAPSPKPIPLQVKVVIVGAPRWYYTFFSADMDFPIYFKVKADIDPDMPADERNLAVYAGLITATAQRHVDAGCEEAAMRRLLGEASRWAGDRRKLSARYELVEDVIAEAAALARREAFEKPHGRSRQRAGHITLANVNRALDERRQRNARVEDRSHEQIRDGAIMIDTAGARIGQVNALTVRDLGDYDFGLPSRVTARVFIGRHGIVNIERAIELGGPLQQKGVLIIGGYLNGRFARKYPLSFSATLTFEQNYGGIEGDSASMAELLAILSALAEVPLRQDIAITGSVNQNGESQAVGAVSRKVEGFYRTCAERGLTGTQGVLVPRANECNLVLTEDVAEAVAKGRFHVWSMGDVDDALELLTGMDPGRPDSGGRAPAGSVAARIEESLNRFDAAMRERASLWS
jgi:predicted ATP-dependent protease